MALYVKASQILEKAESKQGALKTLVYDSKFSNIKQLFALVCETQRFSSVLEEVISSTKLLKLTKLRLPLAKVLVFDLLLGQGLKCGGSWKTMMMKNRPRLQAALARIKVRQGVSDNQDLIPKTAQPGGEQLLPRYVRVNTLKSSVEDALDFLKRDGFTFLGRARTVSDLSLRKKDFVQDSLIPEILVFSPKIHFHDHFLYKAGHIILQDKASCLPAHVLSPPPGSVVLDACAAPGNKTSHLAALMKNQGRILALDLDQKRLSTMATLLLRAGVSSTQLRHQDFLKVEPLSEEYREVEFILLDPSCSGSGMVCLREDSDTDEARLSSLASFQLKCLNHALTFPKLNRLVYSTCSIHRQENEDVLSEALKTNKHFRLVPVLPQWPERGLQPFSQCLRASPASTRTHGFFVALLQRRTETEMEDTPPNTEDTSPNTEDKPPNTEDTPPNTEDTPPSAEDTPPSTEDMATSTEDTPTTSGDVAVSVSTASGRKRAAKSESESEEPTEAETPQEKTAPQSENTDTTVQKKRRRKRKRKKKSVDSLGSTAH